MNKPLPPASGKAIALSKKADLDRLARQVHAAQLTVNQLGTIVKALGDKSQQRQAFLQEASTNSATALADLNLAKDAFSAACGQSDTLAIANAQTGNAWADSADLAQALALLAQKLVFAVELVEQIDQLANKQKASNSLIPDALIGYLDKAAGNGSKAVAATLTALQSTFAASATLADAKQMMQLGLLQAQALQAQMQHVVATSDRPLPGAEPEVAGSLALLQQRYQAAQGHYQSALRASEGVTAELEHAKKQLARANTRLASLQAGLGAANAVARG